MSTAGTAETEPYRCVGVRLLPAREIARATARPQPAGRVWLAGEALSLRLDRRAPALMRATDQRHAGTPCRRQPFGRGCQNHGCSRRAQRAVATTGRVPLASARLPPTSPARRAEHRSELTVEPSFFIPHVSQELSRPLGPREEHGRPACGPSGTTSASLRVVCSVLSCGRYLTSLLRHQTSPHP
jgi:hypothetical protein